MRDLDLYIDVDASLEAMPHQGILLDEVPAMKGVEDLRRYHRVIEATRPDLIIQTGTAVGGSALWFTKYGPDVITIDVDESRVHPLVRESDKITVLTGSSTDRRLVDAVILRATDYARKMVILDSDHSSHHVRREIAFYGPLVDSGCYLVVEDGIYDLASNSPFSPGPLDAIKACLLGRAEWIRDTETEAMFGVSMYPGGWWVKK